MNTDQGPFEYTEKEQEESPSIASQGLSEETDPSHDPIIELTDVIKKGEQFKELEDNFQFEHPEAEAVRNKQDVLGPNDDDLEKIIAGLETELEAEEPEDTQAHAMEPSPPHTDPSPALSRQQIEAHLTEVVREVGEKAVRETVAEVTEKVIREVIDALKESLDTQPE